MNYSGNNPSRCRIVVDAMGGDFAPANAVIGAVEAYNENKSFDLFLVGRKEQIEEVLAANFLIPPEEDIYGGKSLAEACCDSLKEFNPMVHVLVEKGSIILLHSFLDILLSGLQRS